MATKIVHNIGDTVYLRTDREQIEWLVVGYNVRPDGVMYAIVNGLDESLHYGIELSKERDIVKATT